MSYHDWIGYYTWRLPESLKQQFGYAHIIALLLHDNTIPFYRSADESLPRNMAKQDSRHYERGTSQWNWHPEQLFFYSQQEFQRCRRECGEEENGGDTISSGSVIGEARLYLPVPALLWIPRYSAGRCAVYYITFCFLPRYPTYR